MRERIAVIGGGMLGMTLAYRLRQAGIEVTLKEAARELGGLATSWTIGSTHWDRHYHVTLLSDLHLRTLLRELDLESELVWNQPGTGFYAQGIIHRFTSAWDFARFPLLNPLEKTRLAATIWYAAKITDWRRLERISALDWLTRLSGATTVEKVWRPLLRAKLGTNDRYASAAFIWAIIQRMYAARRTKAKREMFGYVRGGYGRILSAFERRLHVIGVTVQLGARVARIAQRPDGAIAVECADGSPEVFDRVVMTLPSPICAQLCPQLDQSEKAALSAIKYQGIVCASLLLKRSLSPYYITNIADAAIPFTGVIEMSALVDKSSFGGNALIYLPKYIDSNDPILTAADEELAPLFLGGLERMYPKFDRDDVIALKLSRIKYVCPISVLNYSENLPSMQTSVRGVRIANSAHILNGTLNVNETVALAERAAAEILQSPCLPKAARRDTATAVA